LSDEFVYVVAFEGGRFVMVRHRDRAWEMPGGRVEQGESFEQAAMREFSEETGMSLMPVGSIEVEGGRVVVGMAGDIGSTLRLSNEITEARMFGTLPRDLSFPLVEYQTILAQAKMMVESFKRKKGIDAPASPQAKQVDSE
jgi:8-oxo-dGTP diphosphatase